MLKRVLAVTAVGSLAVFGMTAVPSAAATKHKGPNVNLKVKKGGGVGFKPSVINATVAPGKSCGKTNYEYSITNKTNVSQNLDLDGNPFGTLSPGQVVMLCANVGETQTYTVPGTSATLTVTTSAPAS
jgi:hypothetical protein